MVKKLFNIEEVIEMIKNGDELILAGDEKLLDQLPAGKWIAGIMPYFMSCDGGVCTTDRIFVNKIPEYASKTRIKTYTSETVSNVYTEAPDNGFSIIIIPALSPVYMKFVMEAVNFENFAAKPLVGWTSGPILEEYGKVPAKVYYGETKSKLLDDAVVYHIELPENKWVEIDIINIFKPGDGDVILFPEDGFSVKEATINGAQKNFADYIKENKLDIKFPLVADMNGAILNTTFKEIDEENRQVHFYAPIFKGVEYKLAVPIGNYIETFNRQLPKNSEDTIFFSCNCVINFFYAELEGKATPGVEGPMAYGEIAYQYLNQTLVYMMIHDL